jgi:hydrogenase expression/formation protein HypC
MCIGIPMQVVTLDHSSLTASCCPWSERPSGSNSVVLQRVDLSLTGLVEPGQWLLVFLGAARECLTPERALQIGQALCALQQVQSGSVDGLDRLFADLDREPQLPEHLRPRLVSASADVSLAAAEITTEITTEESR